MCCPRSLASSRFEAMKKKYADVGLLGLLGSFAFFPFFPTAPLGRPGCKRPLALLTAPCKACDVWAYC